MSRQHRRCYCLLAEEATAQTAHSLNCGVGGHSHLNFAELYGAVDYVQANAEVRRLGAAYLGNGGLLERGEVEWLYFPRIVKLRREPMKAKQQRVQLNDLSARVGAFLAEAVRRSEPGDWPRMMLAEIQRRPSPPGPDSERG